MAKVKLCSGAYDDGDEECLRCKQQIICLRKQEQFNFGVRKGLPLAEKKKERNVMAEKKKKETSKPIAKIQVVTIDYDKIQDEDARMAHLVELSHEQLLEVAAHYDIECEDEDDDSVIILEIDETLSEEEESDESDDDGDEVSEQDEDSADDDTEDEEDSGEDEEEEEAESEDDAEEEEGAEAEEDAEEADDEEKPKPKKTTKTEKASPKATKTSKSVATDSLANKEEIEAIALLKDAVDLMCGLVDKLGHFVTTASTFLDPTNESKTDTESEEEEEEAPPKKKATDVEKEKAEKPKVTKEKEIPEAPSWFADAFKNKGFKIADDKPGRVAIKKGIRNVATLLFVSSVWLVVFNGMTVKDMPGTKTFKGWNDYAYIEADDPKAKSMLAKYAKTVV